MAKCWRLIQQPQQQPCQHSVSVNTLCCVSIFCHVKALHASPIYKPFISLRIHIKKCVSTPSGQSHSSAQGHSSSSCSASVVLQVCNGCHGQGGVSSTKHSPALLFTKRKLSEIEQQCQDFTLSRVFLGCQIFTNNRQQFLKNVQNKTGYVGMAVQQSLQYCLPESKMP